MLELITFLSVKQVFGSLKLLTEIRYFHLNKFLKLNDYIVISFKSLKILCIKVFFYYKTTVGKILKQKIKVFIFKSAINKVR